MSAEYRVGTSAFPAYITNSELPEPNFVSEVMLKGEFGYFEHFDANFLHGFHWENPRNISYMHEQASSSEVARSRVEGAIGNVLDSLEMAPLEQAIFANAIVGNTTIVDITVETLEKSSSDSGRKHLEGGAYFTTLTDVPVYAKAGDCTWTFLHATSKDGTNIGGLIHAGRKEADQMFPAKAIDHVIDVYGAKPESIKLGIIPSLEPEFHTIRNNDYHNHVSNFTGWLPYSRYSPPDEAFHLDVKSFVTDQYIHRGVPAANIQVSTSGTFRGAENGFGFSQRRDTVIGQPSKRFGVAFQLA